MSLDQDITRAINESLKNSEAIWDEVGYQFVNESRTKYFGKGGAISYLPGFPFVANGEPKAADYIALVVDLRNSSKHIEERRFRGTQTLKRVLIETSALNSMGGVIVDHFGGAITEYLGDGFLAFFMVENRLGARSDFNTAYLCADKIMASVDQILNPVLEETFSLPPLEIGVGMAFSKAIVTLMGVPPNIQAKAIGQCVFRASKLSGGTTIKCDDKLRDLVPGHGLLRFESNPETEFESFIITKRRLI